jgi:phage shock protein PspC (stress-responsive transcriptional regulator)
VAAGVAEELGLDPWLVRLGFAVAATAGGLGLPLYLLAWLLLPAEDTGESIAEQLLAPERPAA